MDMLYLRCAHKGSFSIAMKARIYAYFPILLTALGLASCGTAELTYEEGIALLEEMAEGYKEDTFAPPSEYIFQGVKDGLSIRLDVSFSSQYRRERYESDDGSLYYDSFRYFYLDSELGYCVIDAVQANTEDFSAEIEAYKSYAITPCDGTSPLDEELNDEFAERVLEIPEYLLETVSEDTAVFSSDGIAGLTVDLGESEYVFEAPLGTGVSLISSYSIGSAMEETGSFSYGSASLNYPIFDSTWSQI